jgi:hypothetical protein
MAKQGGLGSPLGATTNALVGLSYIFTLATVFIITMCVNGNKLTKSLTFENQQKKHSDQI